MIQINLQPGAVRKTRGRGVSLNLGALTSGIGAKVSDPHLLAAVAGAAIGLAAIGGMWFFQGRAATALAAELEAAEQDSIRFSAVIKERRKTEAQRDSVLTQLALIRSIDGRRYIWSHIMDEVSRTVPSYTWITQLGQQAAPSLQSTRAPADAKGDSAKKKRRSPQEVADSLDAVARVPFRVVGNTVDIQALTRFMKGLEASPFIEEVQLVKSAMILIDGKEVTEFHLDASYQRPDSAMIATTPLSVSVR